MTKTEMEGHRAAYYRHLSDAKSSLQQNSFRDAMTSAILSCDHVDGMMQYERKYEGKETLNVESIDLVLKYAPVLFDVESLDKLELLLKDQRRIAKYSIANLEQGMARARSEMWFAHRLWNRLEEQSQTSYNALANEIGGDREELRVLLDIWNGMGLISRATGSHQVSLSTDMSRSAAARCPSCGAVAKAPKTKLLEKAHCPKCKATVSFVLLASEPAGRSS
jgi:hypothetical protein